MAVIRYSVQSHHLAEADKILAEVLVAVVSMEVFPVALVHQVKETMVVLVAQMPVAVAEVPVVPVEMLLAHITVVLVVAVLHHHILAHQ
jgi:hypothetical protein